MGTGTKFNVDRKRKALALLQKNRPQEALRILQKISRSDRDDVDCWLLQAQLNAKLGRPAKVEQCCRELIRINPGLHDGHFHLASALMLQNKRGQANEALQQAVLLKPDHAPTHFLLAMTTTNLDDSFRHFSRAAALNPAHAESHYGIGAAFVSFGQVEDAVARLQRALQLKPGDHAIRSSLLFSLNYSAAYDAQQAFREHALWGETHALDPCFRHANEPVPGRRLRIGYVSADLYTHSVAYFFEPLLANHDPERIETYCYSDVAKPDATTERLRTLASHWHDTRGLDDRELARRINEDRIDILVDLAGHTKHNRLVAFSMKPAPLQITYLGYPNTTGLAAIDYRFTDAWADPPGQTDGCYTERLVRLPNGFLSYRAPTDAPAVGPSPVTTTGHITFGSFNNLSKVTAAVAACWATILRQIPGSRLILKSHSLSSRHARQRYLQLFDDNGIAAERIELLERDPSLAGHLDTYNRIDIALDTFPYNGTTTTCEALYMGVPVVTLAGEAHAGRVGISLLSQIGATDLIAATPEDYVSIASALSRDPEGLATRRTTLRSRLVASPLCDNKRFAEDVESAYREIWQQWCAQRSGRQ